MENTDRQKRLRQVSFVFALLFILIRTLLGYLFDAPAARGNSLQKNVRSVSLSQNRSSPPSVNAQPLRTLSCPPFAGQIKDAIGVENGEHALCAPDAEFATVGATSNSILALDMEAGAELIDGPGIDFYYYERHYSPGIQMDETEIALAQDDGTGNPGQYTTVFIWGDNDPNNNGTIPNKYLPEIPNRRIYAADLHNETGIGINIGNDDGMAYRFIRFQTHPPSATPDADSRVEVDAVEGLHPITPTPTPTKTEIPTPTHTPTPTPPPSPSFTPTSTATATAEPPTSTATPTATNEPPTDTPAPTVTLEPPTYTSTPTLTNTPTTTKTPTWTPTHTSTPALTPTHTPTSTSAPTDTPTPSKTSTWTPTSTPTSTHTSAPTATKKPTRTPRATRIPPKDTRTPMTVSTPAETQASTNTPTLPINTLTRTSTLTTPTHTSTPTTTEIRTLTPTRTLTHTLTPTVTNTPAPTNTLAPTKTPALVLTGTSISPSPTPAVDSNPSPDNIGIGLLIELIGGVLGFLLGASVSSFLLISALPVGLWLRDSYRRVNINKADAKQLIDQLGISPSQVDRIIAYRDRNNVFRTIDDIGKVPRLSNKTLMTLRAKGKVKPLMKFAYLYYLRVVYWSRARRFLNWLDGLLK